VTFLVGFDKYIDRKIISFITIGRRKIYLISFLINIIGSIGCALSVNVGMFIAFRTISAMGSSSVS
jgi:MFS family permease